MFKILYEAEKNDAVIEIGQFQSLKEYSLDKEQVVFYLSEGTFIKNIDLLLKEEEEYFITIQILNIDNKLIGQYGFNRIELLEEEDNNSSISIKVYCDPSYPGAEETWRLKMQNKITKEGLWKMLPKEKRWGWLSVALHSFSYRSTVEKEKEIILNGDIIDDIASFYCAIGEAVNGPGGYFGWNLDALNDCFYGRWGLKPPYSITWTNHKKSKTFLNKKFEIILEIFSERNVHVTLK